MSENQGPPKKGQRQNWEPKDPKELTQIIMIASKLQFGYELTPQEGIMAGNLLHMIAAHRDVRTLLFQPVAARPHSHIHRWVALDFRLRQQQTELRKQALGDTSLAWKMSKSNVEKIELENRSFCDEVLSVANEVGFETLRNTVMAESAKHRSELAAEREARRASGKKPV